MLAPTVAFNMYPNMRYSSPGGNYEFSITDINSESMGGQSSGSYLDDSSICQTTGLSGSQHGYRIEISSRKFPASIATGWYLGP